MGLLPDRRLRRGLRGARAHAPLHRRRHRARARAASLTDEQPDAGLAPAATPRPRRSARRVAAAGARRRARGARRRCTRASRSSLHPADLARPRRPTARDDAQALAKLLLAGPTTATALKGELGVARRVAWSRAVAAATASRRSAARTRHDRQRRARRRDDRRAARLPRARDALVDEIRAIVPFNLRPLDQPLPRDLGNRFGLVLLALPVGIDDPAERLARCTRAHGRDQALATRARSPTGSSALIGRTPRAVEQRLIDVFTRQGHRWSSPTCPGRGSRSRSPGTPCAACSCWAPARGSVGMSVSIFSYAGEVTIARPSPMLPVQRFTRAATGRAVDEVSSWRDMRVPTPAHSPTAFFGGQHVFLVGDLPLDESESLKRT